MADPPGLDTAGLGASQTVASAVAQAVQASVSDSGKAALGSAVRPQTSGCPPAVHGLSVLDAIVDASAFARGLAASQPHFDAAALAKGLAESQPVIDTSAFARGLAASQPHFDARAFARGLAATHRIIDTSALGLKLSGPQASLDATAITSGLAGIAAALDSSALAVNVGRLLNTTHAAFERLDSVLTAALGGLEADRRGFPAVTSALASFEPGLVRSVFNEADDGVRKLGQRVATLGWWLYPLTPYLPLRSVERMKDLGMSATDDELDAEMSSLLSGLLKASHGGSLRVDVENALEQLDQHGARLRVRVFNQSVRAFKLRSLDAMIPPVMYGQGENLIAVASHRGILAPALMNFFNDAKRPRKLISQYRQAQARHANDRDDVHYFLPVSLSHQPMVLDVLFGQLVRSVAAHTYETEEDILRVAAEPMSRHYATHGGLGYGRPHAARSLAFFVGTVFLLRDLKRIGEAN